MPILAGKPATATVGVPSATITLSPSTLISQMSIVDAYWSVAANWSYVSFYYVDATGNQKEFLNFPSTSNTSIFDVSATARQNTWTCRAIKIFDFDNSEPYVIQRAQFTSITEFDIGVIPVPPVFGSGNLRPEYNVPFTIAFRYKRTDNTQRGIFDSARGYGTGGKKGLYVWMGASVFFGIQDGGTRALIAASAGATGVWNHLALVYSGATGTVSDFTVYLNKVSVSTAPQLSGTVTSMVGADPILIGTGVDIGISDFNGLLDDFVFYQNAALTLPQVEAMYDANANADFSALAQNTALSLWQRYETALTPADSIANAGIIDDRTDNHNGTVTNTGGLALSTDVASGGTGKSIDFTGASAGTFITLA